MIKSTGSSWGNIDSGVFVVKKCDNADDCEDCENESELSPSDIAFRVSLSLRRESVFRGALNPIDYNIIKKGIVPHSQ